MFIAQNTILQGRDEVSYWNNHNRSGRMKKKLTFDNPASWSLRIGAQCVYELMYLKEMNIR